MQKPGKRKERAHGTQEAMSTNGSEKATDTQGQRPCRRRRVRSRTRRAAAAAARPSLPIEVWTVILTHPSMGLAPCWRFCARRVCRLWRDIVADAPAGRPVDPTSGVAYADLVDERQALLEARGRLVRASVVLVQRPLVGDAPATPAGLVAFCVANAGTVRDPCLGQRRLRPLNIVLALLATGASDLVDYAITGHMDRAVNDVSHHDRDRAVRENLTAVAGAAVKIGGLALVERIAAHVPNLDFAKHCTMRDAIAADCVDAVVVLAEGREDTFFRDPLWWKIAGTHDAVGVVRHFIDLALIKTGYPPRTPGMPLMLLQRLARRYDAGPCTVIAAQAAVVHGATRVLDLLVACGGEAVLGNKDTGRDNVAALAERAARAGNTEALAWCLSRYPLNAHTDTISMACDAVAEPPNEYRSDVRVPWDPYRAVRTVAWVRARAGTVEGAALTANDGEYLLRQVARLQGPRHCDVRCVFGLAALFGPAAAACAATDGAKACRRLATTLTSIACETLVARCEGAVAERLTLALEALAADVVSAGGDVDALIDAVDPWSALVRLWGELEPAPQGLAGAMAYVLARAEGRPCSEGLSEAGRAARPGVALWRQESYDVDALAPPVAPLAAWQRWWRPRPVSSARAHDRDAAHRSLWGHGPGPALGDVGTLDAFLFLRARGLLLD
ncbi:hypothetical protein pdul_cds_881 [Pandoravirus dulcis]|uniref:F-box incomplete domain containing protein n=1 Tax=Pandoravirus dulcis TaxID=1349409 RepID=S4VRU6_9VIRU|nr:hypothetical protein pdul_cds_881 [Pandoravirus dulcis]AGO83103.1 hypothetical protein pdul_cds_881 [Pandoravirus dulcis]